LAQQLRAKRVHGGALMLTSGSPKFTLDDNGFPVDCDQATSDEAKELVEEVYLYSDMGLQVY